MEHSTGSKAFTYWEKARRRTDHDALDFILQTGVQLSSALHHLHAQRIAHLDLHRDNVLVDFTQPPAPPCFKLLDFGLARVCEDASVRSFARRAGANAVAHIRDRHPELAAARQHEAADGRSLRNAARTEEPSS